MPKLPVLPPEKLAKVLEKKGFVLDRLEAAIMLISTQI
jgi:predicted RNA binding protein YcfA (HicA-like mRNA interferase family)